MPGLRVILGWQSFDRIVLHFCHGMSSNPPFSSHCRPLSKFVSSCESNHTDISQYSTLNWHSAKSGLLRCCLQIFGRSLAALLFRWHNPAFFTASRQLLAVSMGTVSYCKSSRYLTHLLPCSIG